MSYFSSSDVYEGAHCSSNIVCWTLSMRGQPLKTLCGDNCRWREQEVQEPTWGESLMHMRKLRKAIGVGWGGDEGGCFREDAFWWLSGAYCDLKNVTLETSLLRDDSCSCWLPQMQTMPSDIRESLSHCLTILALLLLFALWIKSGLIQCLVACVSCYTCFPPRKLALFSVVPNLHPPFLSHSHFFRGKTHISVGRKTLKWKF